MKTKKNAGFSLVELIVVIAIMAVLVGVLAPAYLKYVEKSRKSSDVTAIDEMIKSAETVASDNEIELASGAKFIIGALNQKLTLNVQDGGTTTTGVDYYADASVAAEALSAWLDSANVPADGYKMKSKDFKSKGGSATGTLQDTGALTWTYEGACFTAICNHSKDIKAKLTTGSTSTPTSSTPTSGT